MTKKVVPMIHVPDVRATVAWYNGIGFSTEQVQEEGGNMSWALVSFGPTGVMFNEGGKPSGAERREVDLYVYVENIDERFAALKSRVEIVEALHDALYGMREFIIRDPNRFWITFGQTIRSKA